MSLNYELPANLTVEKLIAKLGDSMPIHVASKQYAIKTYYDSFDWRLYSNGLIGELNRTKTSASFSVIDLEGHTQAALEIVEIPTFADQFKESPLKDILRPILDVRALLTICTLDYEVIQVNILNADEKTVLRLVFEKHELFSSRLSVLPVKGYDKAIEHFLEFIQPLNLTEIQQPILLSALRLQGRKPKEYSSKFTINLAPDLRADIASKYIYSHLLKTIKANEHGTIANTDSEFLHDFRVAVRRTRSGLSQIKNVLPHKASARFNEFFCWLGQITTPTRDLDVYLINFGDYKSSLPIEMRNDIDPLHDFLVYKHKQAQKQLAKKLRSSKYLSTLSEWEQFLSSPAPKNPTEANAKLAIKDLASRRILKVYKRVIKEGNAITDQSPADALHTLRKTCKKLRYLIEFFQNLYPENQLKPVIKSLKELQEVLGNFQDYEVQEQHLRLFSEEMLALGVHANTFLAMGVLIQTIHERKTTTRHHFGERFAAFKSAHSKSVFTV